MIDMCDFVQVLTFKRKHCDKSLFLDMFLSLTEFHVEWIYFLKVMGKNEILSTNWLRVIVI